MRAVPLKRCLLCVRRRLVRQIVAADVIPFFSFFSSKEISSWVVCLMPPISFFFFGLGVLTTRAAFSFFQFRVQTCLSRPYRDPFWKPFKAALAFFLFFFLFLRMLAYRFMIACVRFGRAAVTFLFHRRLRKRVLAIIAMEPLLGGTRCQSNN